MPWTAVWTNPVLAFGITFRGEYAGRQARELSKVGSTWAVLKSPGTARKKLLNKAGQRQHARAAQLDGRLSGQACFGAVKVRSSPSMTTICTMSGSLTLSYLIEYYKDKIIPRLWLRPTPPLAAMIAVVSARVEFSLKGGPTSPELVRQLSSIRPSCVPEGPSLCHVAALDEPQAQFSGDKHQNRQMASRTEPSKDGCDHRSLLKKLTK